MIKPSFRQPRLSLPMPLPVNSPNQIAPRCVLLMSQMPAAGALTVNSR